MDELSFDLTRVIEIVISLAANQIRLAWSFDGHLQNLHNTLTLIQAVLKDADEAKLEAETMKNWSKRLKELAYNAEDVLDEYAYRLLRADAKFFGKVEQKMSDLVSPSTPISFRRAAVGKLKEIDEAFDKIKSEMTAFFGLSLRARNPQVSINLETDSYLGEYEIVGRKYDVSEIMEWLSSLENDRDVTVMSIEGMGGLGKTTVAKAICKETRQQKLFDIVFWICVSDDFSSDKILLDMLHSLGESTIGRTTKNEVLRRLEELMKEKTYLIILDDVWNKEYAKWVSLKNDVLKVNKKKGNCILITTRLQQVSEIMEIDHTRRYQLEKLSQDESWSIMVERETGELPQYLKDIGMEIAKNCGGVPLLAMVVGGIMRRKKSKEEWELIKRSNVWDLIEEDNKRTIAVLRLSFDRLPSPSLKQCFSYCSIFPKDFIMEKEDLIQLWMVEGFLAEQNTGNKYFNYLLSCSFFQDFKKDENGNIVNFKMHDLIHDLAMFVTKIDTLTPESGIVQDYSQIRRLRCHSSSIWNGTPTQLRTLIASYNVLGRTIHQSFKSLRVLKFHEAPIEELPDSVGKLIHLRYLDVSRTRIKRLPKTISKLYHLQTLRLAYCYRLTEIPKTLGDLINLRHIYSEYRILSIDVRKLKCLQTLPLFVLSSRKGCRIEDLGCLKQLKGRLWICNLEIVKEKNEALKANIKEMKDVDKYVYEWGYNASNNKSNFEDVLEGLEPHPNAKMLHIVRYPGVNLQPWCSDVQVLRNLVELKLEDCGKCRQLPTLGHLPCLQSLIIISMPRVRRIGDEFYLDNKSDYLETCVFQALKKLELRSMDGLEEWVGPNISKRILVFPCLESLYICDCAQLRSVPVTHRLTSDPCLPLTSLQITSCSELRNFPLHKFTSLKNVKLERCMSLTTVTVTKLTSLQSLKIDDCWRLKSLGDNEFSSRMPLKTISISSCPELMYIPSVHNLTVLEKLDIRKLNSMHMRIEHCKSLKSLLIDDVIFSSLEESHAVIRDLPSLVHLQVTNCRGLKALNSGSLTGLKTLFIGGFSDGEEEWNGLSFIHSTLQQLEWIVLKQWKTLEALSRHTRHLTSLKRLMISEYGGMEEALPEWFGNLSSLEALEIHECKNLNYLPSAKAMKRLTKLQELQISDCPYLKINCTRDTGSEWPKISHIQRVDLSWS